MSCDFRHVRVEQVSSERVRVSGATGRAPSDAYKVSATQLDGYRCAGMVAIVGMDAREKALRTGDAVVERTRDILLQSDSPDYARVQVEVFGCEALYGANARAQASREVLVRVIGRTKGGMNTKLHAVTDANGRPISLFMTAGQVSDYTAAAALLDSLPRAQWLLGDRGHDADWFRDALEAKGITPCIPGRKSRTVPVRYDKRRYKSRNRIEIMCGKLKDWRRVTTRYDRCPTVFLSAIALAATVLFWL